MVEDKDLLIDTPMGKRTWGDISCGLRWLDRTRAINELDRKNRSERAKKAWAKRKQTQQGESK